MKATRRHALAVIAMTPLVIASAPALASPRWDVENWIHRLSALGGRIMLHDDDLQLAWRPEDHEEIKPLVIEFREQPNAFKEAKQFMRDRGLDGYSFGMPSKRKGGAA